jgi:hypothetical protein
VKKILCSIGISVVILVGSCGPRDAFDHYCGELLDAKERIDATGGDADAWVDLGQALIGLARMNQGEDANEATRIAARLVGLIRPGRNFDSSDQLDALARVCRQE